MPKSIRVTCLATVFLLVSGLAYSASAPASLVKPSDYPSLSEKELGHVQWLVKLALQPPGDWSNMGGLEEGQEGLEGYRYQLGYMTYALALAQYHKTPAYRELYQRVYAGIYRRLLPLFKEIQEITGYPRT